MKLSGKGVGRYTGTVHISRVEDGDFVDLQIKVQQLGPEWLRECERQLPPPSPPVSGKTRDPESGAFVPKYDDEDPDYKRAAGEHDDLVTAKRIHDSCVDERIEWETDEALLSRNPKEYYRGIWKELADQFTREELAHWSLTVLAINQVGGSDVALARDQMFRWVEQVIREEVGLPGLEPLESAEAGQ